MYYYLDLKFGLTVTKHLALLEAKIYTCVVFSSTADRSIFGSWEELSPGTSLRLEVALLAACLRGQ